MLLLQSISREIKRLDAHIKRSYGERANYPKDCDDDFNYGLNVSTAIFNSLLVLANSPVDAEAYLNAQYHFIECLNYEATEEINNKHQAVTDSFVSWTNSLKHFPKIVCLCGSTSFYDKFQQANYEETMQGNIVLSVGFYPHSDVNKNLHGEDVGCTAEQKIKLDELHKRKIDLADEVFVLNVGGYIGDSTRSEIEYAQATGKSIRYLEDENNA